MESKDFYSPNLMGIPSDVLGHIFTFLPWYPDFIRISQVCKYFKDIVRNSSYCNHGFNGGFRKLSVQEASVWRVNIFKFLSTMKSLFANRVVWLDLSYTNSDYYVPSFVKSLLSQFPNLERLSLAFCRNFRKKNESLEESSQEIFPKLKALNISEFYPFALRHILLCLPNLEVLIWTNRSIPSYFSFQNTVPYLPKLEVLDLSGTEISISNPPPPNLKLYYHVNKRLDLQSPLNVIEITDNFWTILKDADPFQRLEKVSNYITNIDCINREKRTPLISEIMRFGRTEVLEWLISHGASINSSIKQLAMRRYDPWTPRYPAAEHEEGPLDSIESMEKDMTPLHASVLSARVSCVDLLLSHGCVIDCRDNKGATPLMYACLGPFRHNIIQNLLLGGASLEKQDLFGCTAFHYCIRGIQEDSENGATALRILLSCSKKKEFNIRDHNEKSPLEWATLRCLSTAVSILLFEGAEIKPDLLHHVIIGYTRAIEEKSHNNASLRTLLKIILDCDFVFSHFFCDETPLMTSCRCGLSYITHMILNTYGGIESVNLKNPTNYWTALHYAAASASDADALLQRLIESGANVNAVTIEGFTPLILLCLSPYAHVSSLKVLLEAGANVNHQDKNGLTPLHGAAINLKKEFIELLLEYGGIIDLSDKRQVTPLLAIGRGGNFVENGLKSINLLLSHGANCRMVDNIDGSSLLHLMAASRLSFYSKKQLKEEYISTIQRRRRSRSRSTSPSPKFKKEDFQFTTKKSFIRLITSIIQLEPNINQRDWFNNTPLHVAIQHYNVGVVELLLQSGADLNIRGNRGMTPLCLALCIALQLEYSNSNKKNVVEAYGNTITSFGLTSQFIEYNFLGFGLQYPSWYEESSTEVLHNDIEYKTPTTEIIKMLLKLSPDVNIEDITGLTPLHYATALPSFCFGAEFQENLTILEDVLKLGINRDLKDERGDTPLHKACYLEVMTNYFHTNKPKFQKLCGISSSDFPDHLQEDEFSNSKEQHPLRQTDPKVDLLLKYGTSVNTTNFASQTPLHLGASVSNFQAMISLLTAEKIDVNVLDAAGSTAAHIFLQNVPVHKIFDAGEILSKFLERGQNINLRDSKKRTLLHLIAMREELHVLSKILFQYKKDLDINCQEGDRGNTPLHLAVQQLNAVAPRKLPFVERSELVDLLLENGAICLPNFYGKTPLDIVPVIYQNYIQGFGSTSEGIFVPELKKSLFIEHIYRNLHFADETYKSLQDFKGNMATRPIEKENEDLDRLKQDYDMTLTFMAMKVMAPDIPLFV